MLPVELILANVHGDIFFSWLSRGFCGFVPQCLARECEPGKVASFFTHRSIRAHARGGRSGGNVVRRAPQPSFVSHTHRPAVSGVVACHAVCVRAVRACAVRAACVRGVCARSCVCVCVCVFIATPHHNTHITTAQRPTHPSPHHHHAHQHQAVCVCVCVTRASAVRAMGTPACCGGRRRWHEMCARRCMWLRSSFMGMCVRVLSRPCE